MRETYHDTTWHSIPTIKKPKDYNLPYIIVGIVIILVMVGFMIFVIWSAK